MERHWKTRGFKKFTYKYIGVDKVEFKIIPRDYDTKIGAYGDQKAAAKYCGFTDIPHYINGEWQHCWNVIEKNVHPEFVLTGVGNSRDFRAVNRFYVARQDQVDYLKNAGYKKVEAIGLPIIYINKPVIARVPGSLLIMPQHSLPETKEEWDTDEYALYINSIASNFDTLYLCLHKSCVEKGYWLDAFKDLKNLTIIEGADEYDQNSLDRLAHYFCQVEYVTSNDFGSQIAYASYFGCKASVAGPPPKWNRSNYEDLIFFKNAPEVLSILEDWKATNLLQKSYPQFCVDPWRATLNEQWAAWQLGEQSKKTPAELKSLLGWSNADILLEKPRQILKRISNMYHRTLKAN